MTESEYFDRIEKTINEIESINFQNNWAYEQIVHSLLKISILPILLFREPAGNHIFRSRINDKSTPFDTIESISIPNEEFVLNFARVNRPRQSVFYGSENRPTSYMEFVLQLADKTPFEQEVIITIGAWEIQNDLKLALIFNPSSDRNTKYDKFYDEAFNSFISITPIELRKGTIRFFEFIAEKFAKQVETDIETYMITCAYSNIVFATEQCDGIIYSSVPRGGDAYNVAIKKNLIAKGVLKLKNARMDKFIAKKQSNGKHKFLAIASMDASGIIEDKIEWNNKWKVNQ